jgi:acetyl esterase/lipase
MTIDSERTVLHVPARDLPVPTSISPEAQAVLAEGPMASAAYPPPDDVDAWRKYIAATDRMVVERFHSSGLMSPEGLDVEERDINGVTVYIVTPAGLDPDDSRVFLDIHGGAFIIGGGEVCRGTGIMTARKVGVRVWSVDYRMPPDHPFPAGVDDCMAVYRALLESHRPEQVIVGGGSAGGNLAAALVLRARDEGLPLPAAAVLLTPAMDFTRSGDSSLANRGVDTVLVRDDDGAMRLYAGGHDLTDPYLSPIFGDYSKGFPPTLLATGTRDVLLSDTVRTHRALRAVDVPAELHVLEAAPHGFFRGVAPEDRELDREVRRFIDEHCPVPTGR